MEDIQFVKAGRIIKAVTLKKIKESVNEYYSSEFQLEFSWFIHNVHIKFSNNSDFITACNELNQRFHEEILSAMDCFECYEITFRDIPNDFLAPCKKKQDLVWAKRGADKYR